MKNILIAPSILSANFACLGKDVQKVVNAGANFIHCDIMDNHYVPNLTFGPIICKALRNYGITTPIDAHLMIEPVDCMIPKVAKSGVDYITFHVEASKNIHHTIQLIKDHGCKIGLAFNPETSLNHLDYIVDKLDLILIMSVNPGFSGQTFIPKILNKIQKARKIINQSKLNVHLEVDGGINIDNIVNVAKAGANIFVLGSYIFNRKNYKLTIKNLKKKIKKFCF